MARSAIQWSREVPGNPEPRHAAMFQSYPRLKALPTVLNVNPAVLGPTQRNGLGRSWPPPKLFSLGIFGLMNRQRFYRVDGVPNGLFTSGKALWEEVKGPVSMRPAPLSLTDEFKLPTGLTEPEAN